MTNKLLLVFLLFASLLGSGNRVANRGAPSTTPTWYDSLDYTLTTGYDLVSNASTNGSPITIGHSGNVTKLRGRVMFVNFSCTFRIDLYDASNNWVAGGTKSITSGDDQFHEVTCTPTAVTAGSGYHAVWSVSVDNAISMKRLAGQPTGSASYNNSKAFTDMPLATYTGFTDYTNAYPIGAYVE